MWISTGLALAEHRDLSGLQQALDDPTRIHSPSSAEHLHRMWTQVVAGARPGAHALTPADLRGLDPEERGHVYAALAVALGAKAPPAYRLAANRLLFAVERPYFQTNANPGVHS